MVDWDVSAIQGGVQGGDHMVDWDVSAIQGGVQGGDHMVDWEVSAWAGASLQSYTYTLPNQEADLSIDHACTLFITHASLGHRRGT